MPLVPQGHILLAESISVRGGVFIPDLEQRRHELPPPDVPLAIYGAGAQTLAKSLNRVTSVVEEVETLDLPITNRPSFHLWRADHWVENRQLSPRRVLDYGCGSGRDAVAMAACGHTVTAFDILPDALDRARDLESRYGDGPPVRWIDREPEGEFELVLLMRCGRPDLIQRAWERVAPGGRMWITTRQIYLPTAEVLSLETEREWTRAELVRKA